MPILVGALLKGVHKMILRLAKTPQRIHGSPSTFQYQQAWEQIGVVVLSLHVIK